MKALRKMQRWDPIRFFGSSLPWTLILLFMINGQSAEVADMTQPGDPIQLISAGTPTSEGVTNVIDDQPTRFISFSLKDTSFRITPSVGRTILSGISITSADQEMDRNPTTYRLEGSDDGLSFTTISEGMIPDFPAFFHKHTLFFENHRPYPIYQVTFPTINGSACCLQISEIELLGFPVPDDVTQPGDSIPFTSVPPTLGSEGPMNTFDNSPTKYLVFETNGISLVVVPSVGITQVTGFTITSANDVPDRDPTSYVLEGSDDGLNFTVIDAGIVPKFPERFYKHYFFFENNRPFESYRITFPTINGSTCCMQISEVELLGKEIQGDPVPCDTCIISEQPRDALVAEGTVATFRVRSSDNDKNPKYQWYKNDIAIPGAIEGVYRTSPVSVDDVGDVYHALVTQGGFVEKSNPARIKLFEPSLTRSLGINLSAGRGSFAITLKPTDVAGYHPQAYWNNLKSDPSIQLTDSNNQESPVRAYFQMGAPWFAWIGPNDPDQILLYHFWSVAGSRIDNDASSIILTRLPPGNHSILLYSVGEFVTPSKVLQYEVSFFDTDLKEQKQTLFMRPQNAKEYHPNIGLINAQSTSIETAESGNFVRFDHINPVDGVVVIRLASPTPSNQRVGINAMQILFDVDPDLEPPRIIKHPQSTNGIENEVVHLSVAALGSNLEYQWLREKKPIPGATHSDYYIPAFNEDDAGTYSVIVSNAAGRIMSRETVVDYLKGSGDVKEWLIVHYTFDQPDGRKVGNSAFGIPGELVGPGSWQAGLIDNAIGLNGQYEYVFAPSYPSLSNAMTVSCWVYARSFPDESFPIVNNWAADRPQGQRGQFRLSLDMIYVGTERRIPHLSASLSTPLRELETTALLNVFETRQWMHLAMTANTRQLTLYLNGEVQGTYQYEGNLLPVQENMQALVIGANLIRLEKDLKIDLDRKEMWNGMIDDFGLWNRALSAAEIQAIYTQGSQGLDLSTATIERSFVLPPSFNPRLSIKTDEQGNILLEFSGNLLASTQLEGPYEVVAGATSPLLIAPEETQLFFKVKQP